MIVYLDTSAIVKRYIEEAGSDTVNRLYEEALNGEHILSFSLWNMGEAFSVFDKYYRRGWISGGDYERVRAMFRAETRRLIKLKILRIVPVKSRLLVKTWRLIEKHHIHVADALQVVSAEYVGADKLVTGDRRLYNVSKSVGLDAIYIGSGG